MTYEINPILIKTKTNLHVGDESTNFDIVDNSVQRDSISNLPVINASSLKGALKDFMGHKIVDKSNDTNSLEEEAFYNIFGSDDKQQGLIKFLDSYLLFLPLRSDKKPFYHTTSKSNLLHFIEFLDSLDYKIDNKDTIIKEVNELEDNTVLDTKEATVEDFECKSSTKKVENLLSLLPFKPNNIAILSDENFLYAVEHLPIIARNKLKNGVSENLWYEEIVPRETIFYTAMLNYNNFGSNAEFKHTQGFKAFLNILTSNIIQVGANASIGFGLCDFKTIQAKK